MHRERITYEAEGHQLNGFLCHNKGVADRRPGVVVAHAWRGLDSFARHKAERLASMGYVVLAADVYGIKDPVTTDEKAAELMMPLFLDRRLLQQRIIAAYQTLAQHPLVDSTRIGAIGFCFGGLTVIELLRSGIGVQGVVSFHGVLGSKMSAMEAKTVPMSSKAKGSILVIHGHDDPLVSAEDIAHFEAEMTQANIDWQFLAYGHTSHAFTNPEAPGGGLQYSERADRRSWIAMTNFFDDIFKFSR